MESSLKPEAGKWYERADGEVVRLRDHPYRAGETAATFTDGFWDYVSDGERWEWTNNRGYHATPGLLKEVPSPKEMLARLKSLSERTLHYWISSGMLSAECYYCGATCTGLLAQKALGINGGPQPPAYTGCANVKPEKR